MKYYNINKSKEIVDFKTACIKGQGSEKGLFFPETIPAYSSGELSEMLALSKEDLAFKIMKPYVGNAIPDEVLKQIVSETVNFDFPLEEINTDQYILELFHGPTLAFKDVGARFMSRCLGYFNKDNTRNTTVLVATSGDTGGAVANGFENVEGVNVVILYPSGKVSNVQELQLTTCANNITALEVSGDFDDCQALVKQAFGDNDINAHLQLTSANSINVARWLPQQLYYWFAYQKWIRLNKSEAPVICVPSGNFGNICAGILAHISGMPVKHFIAACNSNDTVPRFLASGHYTANKTVPTISNAMDVAAPSNFVRILELYHQKVAHLKDSMTSVSINDERTKATIKKVYETDGYLLDPHAAVAYTALQDYLKENDWGIILGTAHPVKFPETIETLLGIEIEWPESIKILKEREKRSTALAPSFEAFKSYLLQL